MKKVISLCTLLLLTLSSISQIQKQGKVTSVLQFGAYNMLIIEELSSSTFYKSDVYTTGNYSANQMVMLQFTSNNSSQAEVISNNPGPLYCHIFQNSSSNQEGVSLFDPPVEENGILFFQDDAHLENYYSQISDVLENAPEAIETVLQGIEDQFPGFISYRMKFNSDNNWLDGEFTINELDDVYASDYMSDIIVKSLFNKNKLIGVGNDVIYFHNKNHYAKFDKSQDEQIEALDIEIDPQSDITELAAFESLDKLDEVDFFNDRRQINQDRDQVDVNDTLFYTSTTHVDNVNCNAFDKRLKIKIREHQTQNFASWVLNFFPAHTATLTIDWDHGAPQTVTNYTGNWLTHTFPSNGTYAVTITSTLIDALGGTQTLTDNVTYVVDAACSAANASIQETAYNTAGDYRLDAKLYSFKIGVINIIGSYSHAWREKNNGKWVRDKSDLQTSFVAIFRDNNCAQQSIKTNGGNVTSQKKISRHKTKWWRYFDHQNGDINSNHTMTKSWFTISIPLVLNPC